MCAPLMITAASAAPSSGPIIGIGAYAQSELPFPATGHSACATRGPKSRAGLMAYPVVPPSDNPIAHTSADTMYGPRPGVSPVGDSALEPIAATTTISSMVPITSQNRLPG